MKLKNVKIEEIECTQPSQGVLNYILGRLSDFQDVVNHQRWNEAKTQMVVNAVFGFSRNHLKEKYGDKLKVEQRWRSSAITTMVEST
jgi:hypothetical protein